MKKTIVINAQSEMSAPADLVVLSLTTEVRNKSYDKVMDGDSAASAALSGKLSAAGFPESDLKTTSFRVSTLYRTEGEHPTMREVFDCYVCSHSYSLEFDFSTDALGRALEAASKSGADPIVRVEFDIKDKQAIETKLLQDLATTALERAEILAIASGAKVGGLINIEHSFSGGGAMRMATFACADAKSNRMANFTPADIRVSSNAQFTWELQN